jgi:hypothetical protein
MQWWLTFEVLAMLQFVGTLTSPSWCMIGRWTSTPLSSIAGVGREGDDRLRWMPSKRRSFEVKSFYKVLLPNVDSRFPWSSNWRTKAHLRLAFFTWSASLGKNFTLDKLHKRHIIVIDWCCKCKKSGEIPDHLLLLHFFFI